MVAVNKGMVVVAGCGSVVAAVCWECGGSSEGESQQHVGKSGLNRACAGRTIHLCIHLSSRAHKPHG